uniref:Putative vitamin B12-binding domain containing protein n=1 Tax=viral metagenome TaxID=1070528 RepID=A0A6M3KWX0_9ZZZZ
MNITLINPRLRSWSPTVVPPLGLAYIATSLEDKGHKVKIVDMNSTKVSDSELVEIGESSDVVGVTGMVTEYEQVKRITMLVKRYGSKKTKNMVVVGGALATTFPDELMAFPQVDCVVVGEGEKAVLKAISGDEKLVQMSYVNDLDGVAFPARHLLDMSKYNTQFHDFESKGIMATTMVTSRGCPYSCTFCYKDMWGHKWRGRSPQNIVDEMDSIHKDYDISGFIFNDDTFVLDKNRVIKFCELMRLRNYKWMCNGRVNLMSPSLLEAVASSGCVEIAYGIESGSQEMLDLIKKNITLDEIRMVVGWTKSLGMRVNGYFILGLPGETKESIKKTIDFAEELGLDFYGFSLATPMPNTEMYKYAMENGYINSEYALSLNDWAFKVNVNMTIDCSDKELQDFKSNAFAKFTVNKVGIIYLIKRGIEVLKGIQGIGELKSLVAKVFKIASRGWR